MVFELYEELKLLILSLRLLENEDILFWYAESMLSFYLKFSHK